MLRNMIRAIRLETEFYERVENDPSATREAFLVVVVASLAYGLGMAIEYGEGLRPIVSGLLITLLSWVAWSGLTLWIGTNLTRGPETRSSMGEMLRVLGYAHSPQVLSFFVFLPGLGPILAFSGLIWSLVAGVVAIRQALDFTTERALVTGLIGGMGVILVRIALAFLF